MANISPGEGRSAKMLSKGGAKRTQLGSPRADIRLNLPPEVDETVETAQEVGFEVSRSGSCCFFCELRERYCRDLRSRM